MAWTFSRCLGAVTLAGVLLAAGTALAGTVRGTLAVPANLAVPAASAEGPARFYWEEANGFLETRPERIDPARALAVVLLGSLQEGEAPSSDFELRGGSLLPSTLVAQRGTTLRITNTDACGHELFAEGVEGFAPLQTAPGNARTLPLAQVGTFAIGDRAHAHVRGHLHVVDNLVARAEVQANGQFRFQGVPNGTYTLKVFYGSDEIASQEVTVERDVDLSTVSLRRPGR